MKCLIPNKLNQSLNFILYLKKDNEIKVKSEIIYKGNFEDSLSLIPGRKYIISNNALNNENYFVFISSDKDFNLNDIGYNTIDSLDNFDETKIIEDGKKVDDSNFEIEGQNIQLQFEPLYNDQTKDVKIIYEYPHENPNYLPFALYFKQTDIVAQVLIYTSKDYQIDYVTNKKYTFDKDLNIVYFDGKTTDDTKGSHV